MKQYPDAEQLDGVLIVRPRRAAVLRQLPLHPRPPAPVQAQGRGARRPRRTARDCPNSQLTPNTIARVGTTMLIARPARGDLGDAPTLREWQQRGLAPSHDTSAHFRRSRLCTGPASGVATDPWKAIMSMPTVAHVLAAGAGGGEGPPAVGVRGAGLDAGVLLLICAVAHQLTMGHTLGCPILWNVLPPVSAFNAYCYHGNSWCVYDC